MRTGFPLPSFAEPGKKLKPRKFGKGKTFKIGIKPAYLGMSMNQLYDQLEAESTLKVADKK